MCRIAFLCLLAASTFVASEAKYVSARTVPMGSNPGIVFKIPRGLVDRAFNMGSSMFTRLAPVIPFPDVQYSAAGVDIGTTDMAFRRFDRPELRYSLIPPSTISGYFNVPCLEVGGPFTASRRTLFNTQRDGGQLRFGVNNTRITFKATIGTSATGCPRIDNFGCDITMGNASLKIINATEKFHIDVMGLAVKAVRPTVQNVICPVIKELVSTQLNGLLARIPNFFEVTKDLAVSYRIMLGMAGDFFNVGFHAKVLTSKVSNFLPAEFHEAPCDDAHFVILISDAIFNDLAFHAFSDGKLDFTINNSSYLYRLIQLKRDGNPVCLGALVPQLAQKYGENAAVEVSVKVVKSPKIEFQTGKAVFTGALTANLTITNTSGTFQDAKIDVDASGALHISVVNNSLMAQISVDDVTVHIDDEKNKKYENIVTNITKTIIEDYFNNGLLSRALPLQLPIFVGAIKPQIILSPNTLQIQAEFEYTGFSQK